MTIAKNMWALVFCTLAAISISTGLLFMKVSNIKRESSPRMNAFINPYWLTGLAFLILNQYFNACKFSNQS